MRALSNVGASWLWLCLTLVGSTLAERPSIDDLTYGPSGAKEPPGTRCMPSLWTGSFACCWTYKKSSRGWLSFYSYACNSNPDNEDCNLASTPGDTVATSYNDPHACRREVSVRQVYTIGMDVLNGSMPIAVVDEGKTRQVAFREALVDGLVASINITASIIVITRDADVTDVGGNVSVEMDVRFRINDDQLVRDLNEAIDSQNWTMIEKANETLTNANMAVAGQLVDGMRSQEAEECYTSAFQKLFNASTVSVTKLSVTMTMEEQYGAVFVDGAAGSSIAAAVLLVSSLALLLPSL